MIDETSKVIVEAFGCTDPGCMRDINQDTFLLGNLDTGEHHHESQPFSQKQVVRGPLFVVCDGMGGAAAGDVASKLAVEAIWAEMIEAQTTANRAVYARLLRRALRVANRRVWEASTRDTVLRGMGTTVSAVGLVGDALICAQVGDSRVYVLRGQTLTQVTQDQSVASAMADVESGFNGTARLAPSHVILQALGTHHDLEVALSIVTVRRGDRLLVCTDGLHGSVTDDHIAELLSEASEPHQAVQELIAAAYAAGGPDNVTAIVADFGGDSLHPPTGADDLPQFFEFDPMEEGTRAIAETPIVVRRLAARAGLVRDPGSPIVPATSPHFIHRDCVSDKLRKLIQDGGLPSDSQQLVKRSRLRRIVFLTTFVTAVIVCVWLLTDVL